MSVHHFDKSMNEVQRRTMRFRDRIHVEKFKRILYLFVLHNGFELCAFTVNGIDDFSHRLEMQIDRLVEVNQHFQMQVFELGSMTIKIHCVKQVPNRYEVQVNALTKFVTDGYVFIRRSKGIRYHLISFWHSVCRFDFHYTLALQPCQSSN
tara:strand:- start:540 stop:992 length:453 start_codon:yes stop_codon:yes gene_type:complete